jgi:two-component system heavy metal sensor histidine kinase CusS
MNRFSLTTRLTVLFAAGSCVVLLALGWMIGASIERHFEDLDRDALQSKLMLAHHAIARVASTRDLHNLSDQLADAIVGHHDLMLRVLGPQHELVLASSSIDFPADWQQQIASSGDARLFEWTQDGRHYRGLASAMTSAVTEWPPLHVAVALDVEHHEVFMRAFQRTLWLFVAGAAIATGMLGWVAASRGLAPLKAMRALAHGVTATTLDQRLPTAAVPAELAELARTLNEMLARLEDAFQRLSDFSSDIAHELRTPVSNLMTQTQVSLARARDAASYREVLESNAEEYERLARMISDMLYLAKAESALAVEHLVLQQEEVDLGREVRELFDFYEALAEENGIHMVLVGTARTIGNRLMLRRAVSNLLSNALRYAVRGGTVSVDLEVSPEQLRLTVENPGETIAAHHLEHLFDRFYRADSSRHHAAGEGTGLGLAITRAIVHAHQGQVSATSAAGITRFTISLPVPP